MIFLLCKVSEILVTEDWQYVFSSEWMSSKKIWKNVTPSNLLNHLPNTSFIKHDKYIAKKKKKKNVELAILQVQLIETRCK